MRSLLKFGTILLTMVMIGHLLAVCAQAAQTPNSIITIQTPSRGIAQFLQGTDTALTYKTLYTAGANGSRCWGLTATTDDGVLTHLVTVQVVNSAVKYGFVAFVTKLSAGFADGVPPMAIMATPSKPGLLDGYPSDSDGNQYDQINSGDTIQATYATALTTSTRINLRIICGDF